MKQPLVVSACINPFIQYQMRTIILAFVTIGSVLTDAAVSPPTDNTISGWADKLSLVGALGYFLWYFMQDRKETKNMYEQKLKDKDTLIQQLYDKIVEQKKS